MDENKKRKVIAFEVNRRLFAAIEQFRADAGERAGGVQVSRSAATRALVIRGLEEYYGDAGEADIHGED